MARGRKKKQKRIIEPHFFEPKKLEEFVNKIVFLKEGLVKAQSEAAQDIKLVLNKAAKMNFHPKIVRKVAAEAFKVKHAKSNAGAEAECLNDYREAMGLFANTPLGAAARQREEENPSPENHEKSDAEKLTEELDRQPDPGIGHNSNGVEEDAQNDSN